MRIKDWGYTVAVLGVCFLLMCGCDSRSDEGLSLSNGPDAVYLDINVALRDASASGRSVSGRAEEEMYGEVTEAEKMHTLRVILVRPDGRVEHNVYLDLKNASVSDRYGKIRLKVQGNEEKTIYLLGNEGSASVELPAVEGEKVVLKKKEITLKLTRAAVKFTYEITNKSSRDYWLSVIRIDKSASHEYLLPNGMTYDDAENVTDFQVPAAKYTPFNQLYKENKKLTAKSTEPVKLPSFYLSEGKYENANDTYSDNTNGNNYKTSYKTAITLDTKDNSGEVLGDRAGNTSFGEFTLESFFPNLSALPRNTHVVVRITINDANDISWQVDLRPYGEVVLEPEFGI